MAKNEIDVTATLAWSDLTAIYPELAGMPVRVQNKSSDMVAVNFSASGTAPGDDSGYRLMAMAAIVDSAAHIWVKSMSGSATIACGLEDVASSGGTVAVSSLPAVQLAVGTPAVLVSGTAYNFTAFATVSLQVDAISGGDVITFAKSVANGGQTYAVVASDETGESWPGGITAPGLYSITGRGWVTPIKTGTASAAVLTAFGHQ